MDVCVVNAYILYKKLDKDISLKEFNFNLCKEILCKSFRKKKISYGLDKK